MSNLRSILLLLFVIASLAFLNLYSVRSGNAPRAIARTTLIESDSAVSAFSICHAGGDAVRLEKRGGSWRMVEPFEGGVDERVVLKVLDRIAYTRITDVMGESELQRRNLTRADFTLENPLMTLDVELNGKSETFGFGRPTPAGDGVYVSIAGLSAVFVAPAEILSAVDMKADSFRLKSLVIVGPESVRAFEVKRGAEQSEQFDRTADGWKTSSGKPSVKRIEDFLAALSAAEASEFVWPKASTNGAEKAEQSKVLSASALAGYGLDPDSAITVTLKCIDGRDRQVSFGKGAGAGLVNALIHEGGTVVAVSAGLKDALTRDKKLFSDSRLFPVESSSVTAFTLVDGSVTCTLARDAAGAWRLEQPVSAPADSEIAEAVLKKILALMPSDLDANGITVTLPSGCEPAKVAASALLGKDGFSVFRSREVLRLDPQLVKRLSVTPEGAAAPARAVSYSRESRTWSVDVPEGAGEVDSQTLDAVLTEFNPLLAERVVSLKADQDNLDDFGLDKPYLTIAIDPVTEEAVRRNLIIGAETENGRYATIGSSDAVFVISDSTVRKLSVSFVRKTNGSK